MRGWDKEFEHTPYTLDELKQLGFNVGYEFKWHDVSDGDWVKWSIAEVEKICRENDNCFCNLEKGRVGYWEEMRDGELKLRESKVLTRRDLESRLKAEFATDSLFFLPRRKRNVPFVYRVHMRMSDGGMNNSHTTYVISVADFEKLKKILFANEE